MPWFGRRGCFGMGRWLLDKYVFKIQVEELGSDCRILKYGDEIEVYRKGTAPDNAHLNK